MKSQKQVLLAFIGLIAGLTFTGCTATGGLIIYPEPVVIGNPPPEYDHDRDYEYERGKRRGHYRRGNRHYSQRNHRKGYVTINYGRRTLRIPPGHMPLRGECRIWYVNRPPGHQPAPGSCRVLRRYVPHNAVLLRG
ncbi:MAG: hypothetical protein R3283_01840 [Balneolaceae bacterium]|nr:hypothetical protein [Balneolaceae bacterium]